MKHRIIKLKEGRPKNYSVEIKKISKTTDFASLVYSCCKRIPKGKVVTYSTIASAIGNPKAVRAVGSALRKNPHAPIVPCHRVVSSNRSLGGFYGDSNPQGELLKKKMQMLLDEGVQFENIIGNSLPQSTNLVRISNSSILTEL